MSLYLMRHGETDWNKLDKIQGKVDIELNDVGKQQAKDAIDNILTLDINKIICSTLTRAKQTANIINQKLNVEIVYNPLIQERNFGILEGYRKKDFPWAGIWDYKNNIQYPDSEDIHTFYKRIEEFIKEIGDCYTEQNVLIVAHGGVCIPLIANMTNVHMIDPLEFIPSNCEIVKLK